MTPEEILRTLRNFTNSLRDHLDGESPDVRTIVEQMKQTAALVEYEFDRLPIHFTEVPFKAYCGADVPNQRTATALNMTTCPRCIDKAMEE